MKEKTIRYIAKGVLLYITMTSVFLLLSAVSTNFFGFFIWMLINFVLIIMCTHCINYDEFLTITGNKFLAKHYPELFDDKDE